MIFCLICLVVVGYSTGFHGTGHNDLLQAAGYMSSDLGRARGPYVKRTLSLIEGTNGKNKRDNRLTRILKRYSMDTKTVHNDFLMDEHKNMWSVLGRSGTPSLRILKRAPSGRVLGRARAPSQLERANGKIL